jgi:hypothetical protein
MTRDKEKPAQIAWEYITWRLRATQTNWSQHLLFVDIYCFLIRETCRNLLHEGNVFVV